ncbi:unnamed protein product [Penicillium camemberti]|uniref:Str. FM013 n=1 Tax=Penicillium camemberti (strain FM 013) TaxID=1429867 RepID=A0A0G4PC93_PENC3|nr:unnamed protein product [Penicillium camemberti]
MRDPGGKPDRPLLQSRICLLGKETPAERRVWADPPVRLNLSGLTGSRLVLSIKFVAVKFQVTSFDAGF